MTDRYQAFTQSGLGRFVVKNLGLPEPTPLQRWTEGAPLVDGPVLVGGVSGTDTGKAIHAVLSDAGVQFSVASEGVASSEARHKALVFDASGMESTADLTALQRFFSPVVRQLATCGRIVVVGTTLRFLVSPKSAYVDGQVVRVGTDLDVPATADPAAPLAGKVALVTGAGRGIGEAIAKTLARDGATVIGADVPQLANDLHTVITGIDGSELLLDITAVDAPQRIAAHAQETHGGLDIVVHNAGITRDKRLANMRTDAWDAVLDVNLRAPERITNHLVESGALRDGGSIVGVSSIAGIAGNNGQTNYATSKAGVIGLVQALAPKLAERQIRINAVAPGFIETRMTAKVPLAIREAGRRMNSLAQGGRPVDVAETIAWFADPESAGVTGNVVRVCGQSLLGA